MSAERGRQHLKPLRRAPEMQLVRSGQEATKLMQFHSAIPAARLYQKFV
jgi:hypothetical protein